MNNTTYETIASYRVNGSSETERKTHATFDAALTFAMEECEYECTRSVEAREIRNGEVNRSEFFQGEYA
jgi:hypothetical protein